MTPDKIIKEITSAIYAIGLQLDRIESTVKAMESKPDYNWSAFYENMGCRFKRITETPEN